MPTLGADLLRKRPFRASQPATSLRLAQTDEQNDQAGQALQRAGLPLQRGQALVHTCNTCYMSHAIRESDIQGHGRRTITHPCKTCCNTCVAQEPDMLRLGTRTGAPACSCSAAKRSPSVSASPGGLTPAAAPATFRHPAMSSLFPAVLNPHVIHICCIAKKTQKLLPSPGLRYCQLHTTPQATPVLCIPNGTRTAVPKSLGPVTYQFEVHATSLR